MQKLKIFLIISAVLSLLQVIVSVRSSRKLSELEKHYARKSQLQKTPQENKSEKTITKDINNSTPTKTIRIINNQFIIDIDNKNFTDRIKETIEKSQIWRLAVNDYRNHYNNDSKPPVFVIKIWPTNQHDLNPDTINWHLEFNVKNSNSHKKPLNQKKELKLTVKGDTPENLTLKAGVYLYLSDLSDFQKKEKYLIQCFYNSSEREKTILAKEIKNIANQGAFDLQRIVTISQPEINNITITGKDYLCTFTKEYLRKSPVWQFLIINNLAPDKIDIKSRVKLDDKNKYVRTGHSYVPGTACVDLIINYADANIQMQSHKERTPSAVSSHIDPYKTAEKKALEHLLTHIVLDQYLLLNNKEQSKGFNGLINLLDQTSFQKELNDYVENVILQLLAKNPENITYIINGLSSNTNRLDDKCRNIIKNFFNESIYYLIKGLLHFHPRARSNVAIILRNNIDKLSKSEKYQIIDNVLVTLKDFSYRECFKQYVILAGRIGIFSSDLEQALLNITESDLNHGIKKTAHDTLKVLNN